MPDGARFLPHERFPLRNGDVSFWFSQLGPAPARPALGGDLEVDVAIVGAGYTGLWSAYYLAKADPSLRIAVLESHHVGYGASGRNGGWVANSITGGREDDTARVGRAVEGRFQEIFNDAVDEVGRVAAAEGIDAHYVKGGELLVARNPAQLERLKAEAAHEESWPEDSAVFLSPAELATRVNVAGALGAMHVPHCARIQPARLARGLADAVERLGVTIYEGTTVLSLEPGSGGGSGEGAGGTGRGAGRGPRAVTDHGTVSAAQVLRCTEGFTASIKGLKRDWLPMNSSMIVTEPLPESLWEQIGWDGMETLEDMAHGYVYLQRTEDGRIAIGGRGKPYKFGSATDLDGDTPPETVAALTRQLHAMFPGTVGLKIDHAWSGVLGVPRNWKSTVGLDPVTGLGWAGGYVGTGVTATNVAGRTLADLVLGVDSELTRMPWVNRRVRKWEVEPLRWIAVHVMYALFYSADRSEDRRGGSTRWWAKLANAVSGRGH